MIDWLRRLFHIPGRPLTEGESQKVVFEARPINMPHAKPIVITVTPGRATLAELMNFFRLLSNLYRACNGDGLEFKFVVEDE